VLLELLSSPLAGLPEYDMTINLGILCRAKLYIAEKALFRKRYARITDTEDRIDEITLNKPYVYGTLNKNNDFQEYKKALLKVSRGTEFEELVQSLMEYRQELQKDINLTILELNEEHNQEMALQIEAATWKFAKWTWLRRLLKYINSLQKQYFRKAKVDYDKSK
jgi:hypothetical protein